MSESFRIIETFGYVPEQGMTRGARHLARMARTAAKLDVAFDQAQAEHLMAEFHAETPRRMRMTLDRAGGLELQDAPLAPSKPLFRVQLHETRLDPADPWLPVKTTERSLYDQARADLPEGIDEMLFLNTRGELCEGTITNVFLERNGDILTPALSSGLLPGVLREELLSAGRAQEAVLTVTDLRAAERLWVGNSLRGLIPAQFVG
ncbi:aminotransferase class IV family protein [Celeribacter sp. PS-C1]|uniref:aminotransferase class IV family protein n=1 Tax=Celeribacter sp. PS-C1 TaxID=2820813 RepID=UPI001C667774|nr:aminotransferase class IV family protein [Celeribacter sp. PS-C1]MBW6419382.1 aminotransferase class IV family protein [Celeribacter sp. PS-C1]